MKTRTDASMAAVSFRRDRKAFGSGLPVWRQAAAQRLSVLTIITAFTLAALFHPAPAAGAPSNSPSSGIRLLGRVIDTSTVVAKSRQTGRHVDKFSVDARVRTQALSSRGTLAYIVQFSGPIREEWKTALRAAGADIKGYVPENAFIVEADPSKLDQIGRMEAVQWIGEYQADYKIQPQLKSLARARTSSAKQMTPGTMPSAQGSEDVTPDLTVVTITTFSSADVDRVAQAVNGVGGQVQRTARGARHGLIRAQIAIEALEALSVLGEVEWIEEYVPPVLHNNVAAEAPRMNVSAVWTNYGLTGAGQVVGVADTGLDTGSLGTLHPDFTGRVRATHALGRPGDWSDPDGHGTHTSGSVLGDGSAYSNGLFRGAAYGAELVFQSVMDAGGGLGGIPADLNDLFLQTYTNGARVHSDSWGSSLNGYYSADCGNVDEFMWNYPDMLVVFSAGNDGRDGPQDGVVDLHRMGAPGTSKNVLTVGASESQRPVGSGGYSSYPWGIGSWLYYYPVPPISTDYISTSADGIHQGMAAFSSRGPCNDGRIKPDIVAPGTDIISCRSRAPGAGTGWGTGSGVLGNSASNYYVFMGGTSMSTPLTAGSAALVRQYLMERRGFTNPCAALVKATLINGARSLSPGQYGTGTTREVPPAPRPNNVEGWGQVNLAESLFPGAGCTNIFYDATNSLGTGASHTHTFAISSTNRLSVTLAWTDYPATLSAATKLVNDLDLLVILPNGETNYAFGRSDFDRINNVEGLDLDPAPQGTLTIRVIGYNIPSGPQPYALVIRTAATSGLAKATGPAPAHTETGVSKSARLSWGNAGGATEFNVYFGINASPGPSEFKGAQSATWFNPGNLDDRTTYYWRVDAVNQGGTVTGDVWSFTTAASVVFYEGFENGGVIPSGWTQTNITGSRAWSFLSGGWPGSYCPSSAHGGSYNACLYYYTSQKTMLVSPPINFGITNNNPELTFWHYMEDWIEDQDLLRVYYRTNSTAAWISLTNYLGCTTPWTKRTVSLPSPGATYYIAFEGETAFGNGVCIDDVEVTGIVRGMKIKPSALTYSAFLGMSNLTAQTFAVTNEELTAIDFTNIVSYIGTGGWFTPSATTGHLEAAGSLTVTGNVDITGLNTGVYSAINTFVSPNAANSPQTMIVTLSVFNPIKVAPSALTYMANFGSANPDAQTFAVSNIGSTAFNFTNTVSYCSGSGANTWFTPSTTTGHVEAAGSLTVTGIVDITGLTPGKFYATNSVTAPGTEIDPQTMVATLRVFNQNQRLWLSTPGTNVVTAGQTVWDTIQVANTGAAPKGVMAYTLAATSGPPPWLSVSPTSGDVADNINTATLMYVSAGLSPGWHTGQVHATAFGDIDDYSVDVVLRVNHRPGVAWNAADKVWTNTVTIGDSLANTSVQIWNPSPAPTAQMRYQIYVLDDPAGWVSVSPASGTSTGDHQNATVSYSTTGLVAGVYTARLMVEGRDIATDKPATNGPMSVSLQLTVQGSGPVLKTDATSLSRTVLENNSGTNSFLLWNEGKAPRGGMRYTVTPNVGWATALPATGTVTDNTQTIQVHWNAGVLSPANYSGSLVVDAFDAHSGKRASGAPLVIALTLTVTNRTPVNLEPPTVVGTMHIGQTVTLNVGLWKNQPRLTFGPYQWERASNRSGGGHEIVAGATASNYVVTASDRGKYLRVAVTATDSSPSPLSSVAYSEWTSASKVRAVPGDFDGNGLADLWFYDARNGTWHMNFGTTNSISGVFGMANGIATPGDYDGDGYEDVGVYDPANGMWHILFLPRGEYISGSLMGGTVYEAEATPMPADYDGDGATDLAFYWMGYWVVLYSSRGTIELVEPFANAWSTPVAGDWDGNGVIEMGTYLNGVWTLRMGDGSFLVKSFGGGANVNIFPAPGDYDGDSITDLAVHDADANQWRWLASSTGIGNEASFGSLGGIPMQGYYDYDQYEDFAQMFLWDDYDFLVWLIKRTAEPIINPYYYYNIANYHGQSYQLSTGIWRVSW